MENILFTSENIKKYFWDNFTNSKVHGEDQTSDGMKTQLILVKATSWNAFDHLIKLFLLLLWIWHVTTALFIYLFLIQFINNHHSDFKERQQRVQLLFDPLGA